MSCMKYFVGNTSPANKNLRSLGEPSDLRPPRCASMLSIEGTEYQTVMPRFDEARRFDREHRQPRGTSTNVAAATRRGEEVEDREIEVQRRHAREHVVRAHPEPSAAHRTNANALRCESITPFGRPVDPEV